MQSTIHVLTQTGKLVYNLVLVTACIPLGACVFCCHKLVYINRSRWQLTFPSQILKSCDSSVFIYVRKQVYGHFMDTYSKS